MQQAVGTRKWEVSGSLELIAKTVPQQVFVLMKVAMRYADGNLIGS